MAAVALTKVSSVIIITQTSGYPKSYFLSSALNGKYMPTPDGLGVIIYIGGDSYTVKLSELSVNGQIPSTLSTALVLLNSIFGV